MGMSIEEAHGILSNGLVNAPSEHEWCVAFKMAIDTMRKYQKISDAIKFADDNELGYEYIGEKVYEVFLYDR